MSQEGQKVQKDQALPKTLQQRQNQSADQRELQVLPSPGKKAPQSRIPYNQPVPFSPKKSYIENARLRNSSNVNQQNFNNSVSAINPSTFEIDNTSLKPLPQNSVVQEMPENESEQVLNKIEFLMSELTRLMDNLENVKDNTVDNRDH